MRRKPRSPHRQLDHMPEERYEYVLIVCEGEKTEPYYFKELRKKYRLSAINIQVTSADGSDPVSVVRTARSRQNDRKKTRQKPFDRIYCVFDRDEHSNFDAACQQLADLQNQGFRSACSWPCFEFWLLLHFRYTRGPFVRDGKRTAAQNCEHALRSEMNDYRKGKTDVFVKLLPRLEEAKKRAIRALQNAKETDERNSSTKVHQLVDYLQTLSR
uniref:RloB-like protein n=1 Tax=Candidatus Kentrum sp. TUN TaxID=2126343 RepID=A0A450ZGT4_9GAMM|nr:MAG: RloB-like protein [Candidatus Kentron sp. TUN]VFK52967.1 MAG: RloB-like protein [Candidatus Kentron sp. TUN]